MIDLADIPRTPASSLSREMLALCESVQAKRARTVINHILHHGLITADDLSDIYGYDHPPRAIRDVRDNGIPLITYNVINPRTGRRMGAYVFGDTSQIRAGRVGGRKAFSKLFKAKLIALNGSRDAITGVYLEERYLQIDHRIPYAICGDDTAQPLDPRDFMLLDASSNRAKSWSCENCINFRQGRDPSICAACFWATPENYSHIAGIHSRRLDLVWNSDEVEEFERLKARAESKGVELSAYVKSRLRK